MTFRSEGKIVYAVSFMPSFEGASVGGFDWYFREDDAREALVEHLTGEKGREWTHDYTIRSMLVPRDADNEEITALLDNELRELREVGLPEEWEAIRSTGVAVELEGNE